MSLSVLLPVYSGTQAIEFAGCLTSLENQTLTPDEILLVKDGPLKSETEDCLKQYNSRLPIQLVEFPKHRGLGPVLRDALPICTHKLVARVDSDDRCLPDRFEKQVKILTRCPDISVVGGRLRELYHANGKFKEVIRDGPTTPEEVVRYAKFRNPLNHPTVMFRKAHVLASGSYEKCDLFEDYLLWVKMIQSGYHLMNTVDLLVETDVASDYFRRRGGFEYIKNEINLCVKLRRLGFLSITDMFTFLLTRTPIRLLPWFLRKQFYELMLRE